MKRPKFTIITVCYNAEEYIEETINSLLQQQFKDYEYIIKDGMSTDTTMNKVICMTEGDSRVRVLSTRDRGIYDAMNQAVKMALGEYIFFLNAGDYFCNSMILSEVDNYLRTTKADVVYGNIFQLDAGSKKLRKYGSICSKRLYFLTGDCICHQAMFARKELFNDRKFDLNYKVCADKEWQLYQIIRGKKFCPMSFPVAIVRTDGFSKDHIKEFEEESERCLNQHLHRYIGIYKLTAFLKKNRMTHIVLKMLAEMMFLRKSDEERSEDNNCNTNL